MSIKEIEQLVRTSPSEGLLEQLQNDERKGVQQLIKKINKEHAEKKKLLDLYIQMSQHENSLKRAGKTVIAGVDEVGRGCLAGPVVAAAVILPDEPILGVFDSKKMSASRRKELCEQILHKGIVGIGIVAPHEIDQYNIYEATKMAMSKAVLACSPSIDHLLIDAMKLPLSIPQTSIIQGDQKSVSIAAASIVAKVKRDEMMKSLAEVYPQYGFDRNVGYGTKEHLIALKKYGATREHRYSFSPVSELVSNKWSESR